MVVIILGHGSWRQEGGRNRSGFQKGGKGGKELKKSSKWAQKLKIFGAKNFFLHFQAILRTFRWVFKKISEKFFQSRGVGWWWRYYIRALQGGGLGIWPSGGGKLPPPCPCMVVISTIFIKCEIVMFQVLLKHRYKHLKPHYCRKKHRLDS